MGLVVFLCPLSDESVILDHLMHLHPTSVSQSSSRNFRRHKICEGSTSHYAAPLLHILAQIGHAESANEEKNTQLKKKTDGTHESDRGDQTFRLRKDMHKYILEHSAYRGNIFYFLALLKLYFPEEDVSPSSRSIFILAEAELFRRLVDVRACCRMNGPDQYAH